MSALQLATAEGNVGLGFVILLVVGALNAAIGAAYYLRIVALMFFQPATEDVPAAGGMGALSASLLCGALVVLAGIAPGSIMHLASQGEMQLQQVTSHQSLQSLPAPTAVVQQLPAE